MPEPSIKLLPSGYWHVRWHGEYWAQWPCGAEPTIESVFDPEWNGSRFLTWWEKEGREAVEAQHG